MKAYLVATFIGIFALDERKKVIAFKPFPKDPKLMAQKFKLAQFKITAEERELQTKLWKRGYKEFVYPARKSGVKQVDRSKEDWVMENLQNLAISQKFIKSKEEFNRLLVQFNVELTKTKMRLAFSRDALVVQVIRAIEELEKSLNVFCERLREWYGLHFPELNRAVSNHEKFAKLVKKFGKRDNIKLGNLNPRESVGAELEAEDVKLLQSYASQIIELFKLKNKFMDYLEEILKAIAPNLTTLAGTMLAAKLIAKAGSLERLAKAPSSFIQLLGSEKSLFRYLHGKGKPPKHGIIFLHPLIQKVPKEQRGKVARALASKLTIAAKIDFYSKVDRSKKLMEELEQRVKEITS